MTTRNLIRALYLPLLAGAILTAWCVDTTQLAEKAQQKASSAFSSVMENFIDPLKRTLSGEGTIGGKVKRMMERQVESYIGNYIQTLSSIEKTIVQQILEKLVDAEQRIHLTIGLISKEDGTPHDITLEVEPSNLLHYCE